MVSTMSRHSELTEEDIGFARLAIRVHCRIDYPAGAQCLSCANRFPCDMHMWARDVLLDAGWTSPEIDALDVRSSVWS
jgi:hypothetical protein